MNIVTESTPVAATTSSESPGDMTAILAALKPAWTPYELQAGRFIYVTRLNHAARKSAVLLLEQMRYRAEIESDPVDTHDTRLRVWPYKAT